MYKEMFLEKNLSLKTKKFVTFLGAFLFLSLNACSFPSHKSVELTVAGTYLNENGQPLANKELEILVPAGYGLETEHIEEKELWQNQHLNQKALVFTDLLGTFSATFKPISYPVRYWLIPPKGTQPKRAPYPFFYMRVPDNNQAYYSIVFNSPSSLSSLVYQKDGVVPLHYDPEKPTKFIGRLYPSDTKDNRGWIANILIRKVNPKRLIRRNSKR